MSDDVDTITLTCFNCSLAFKVCSIATVDDSYYFHAFHYTFDYDSAMNYEKVKRPVNGDNFTYLLFFYFLPAKSVLLFARP